MLRVGLLTWLLSGGCMGPWDPDWDINGSDGTDVPEFVSVNGMIRTSTRWTSDTTWVLTGPVYVLDGAKLTIEAGTTILGEQGSVLVITRDGSIDAQGTPTEPVVFTSDAPVGERVPGDWGGLALLGSAPTSGEPQPLPALQESGNLALYGGSDGSHSCGVLSHVRVEFAGLTLSRELGLDALTLAGCGSETLVERVQVHRSAHDGVHVLGGRVGLQHLLVTAPGEDGLDWDQGWTGFGQFIVVQQQLDYRPEQVDSALNGSGNSLGTSGTPGTLDSSPFLSNITLVGPGSTEGNQVGIKLSAGTAGQFINVLTVGMGGDLFDVCDPQTAAVADEERLGIRSLVAHDIGVDGRTPFRREVDEQDDDGGFDELALFEESAANNRMVSTALVSRQSGSAVDPDFIPLSTVWVDSSAAERPPEGVFWDEGAWFVGALEPGSSPTEAWYAGWSAFPVD